MNPLCTLRYSATHVDKHHMVFRLDAVDAYECRLVKQIEVASATVKDAHNKPYVRLLSVGNTRGVIGAKVALDVKSATVVQRREVSVQDGDDLEQTAKRAVYRDCRVGEIRVEKGNEFMELRVPGGERFLQIGETWGDVDPLAVQREMFKDTRGNTRADDATYNLIMRDKEKLLSLDTPLKFIFSHSALREGWDNPNVFQICTLRDIQTERERRQSIGRGLRLCVNQDGERVRGFETNTLTVVANEGFEAFAENLQKEIEKDTGIRFGIVERHQFAAIPVTGEDGRRAPLGVEQSEVLWKHLKAQGYIDARGRVQDALKQALKGGTVSVPEPFAPQLDRITEVLRKLAGRLEIRNADERRPVRVRKEVFLSPEFKALWDRIKHKTTYRLRFDNEKLIEDCIVAVRDAPAIPKARLQWRKADIAIGRAGVETTEREGAATVVLTEADIELPDVLTDLQDRTQLTRRSIQRILSASGRLDDFRRNPQQFIDLAAEAINRCKRLVLVDGIRYQRLGDEHYYAQELFEQEELIGYLRNMLEDTTKSVYEHVVFDSGAESAFADRLEKNTDVRVYAKLPGWFTVRTPPGGYNPDWAVLIGHDGAERLYLVVETKGSLFATDLRRAEGAKIACGKAHFKALEVGESPARYMVVSTVDDMFGLA